MLTLEQVEEKVRGNLRANKYIPLPASESKLIRDHYTALLQFPLQGQRINLYTGDTLIAIGYQRIVVGDYGAYMEFTKEQLQMQHIRSKWPGEPTRPVKYIWLEGPNGLKVYEQRGIVGYADYKADMYYIAPTSLHTKEQPMSTVAAPADIFKIMVTGHRPDKVGGYIAGNPTEMWVREQLRTTLKEAKAKHPNLEAISGMALGVDTWWAEEANALQIPWHAYVPFEGQERKWPESSQNHYQKLLQAAKTIVYVCPPGYAGWKLQKRNEAMVNTCTVVVAVWDGSSGGTSNCIRYALAEKKPIYQIDPQARTRRWVAK